MDTQQDLVPVNQGMPVAEPQGDSNMEKLNLQLLGEFSLRRGDGRPVALTSKKNRALLAILALSPGLHATRENLAYLLWGSHSEDAARNSFVRHWPSCARK